mmetsp:Transcript_49336/g.63299  ORF Transcript_49336/g.63299 Transcript_49336/m.63299 type:complete len:162 (+) Transcript_49336:719-1204(+)
MMITSLILVVIVLAKKKPTIRLKRESTKVYTTPIKIGKINDKKGDAGYCLEEKLSGGRFQLQVYKTSPFKVYNVSLERRGHRGRPFINYTIASTWFKKQKSKEADYKPTGKDLSEVDNKTLPKDVRKNAPNVNDHDKCVRKKPRIETVRECFGNGHKGRKV